LSVLLNGLFRSLEVSRLIILLQIGIDCGLSAAG
jgi:hypothetical protein